MTKPEGHLAGKMVRDMNVSRLLRSKDFIFAFELMRQIYYELFWRKLGTTVNQESLLIVIGKIPGEEFSFAQK